MATPPPPPQHVPPKKSNTMLWVLLGGGIGCAVLCAGLIVGAGILGFKKFSKYSEPVTRLNKAIADKDYALAYDQMSAAYKARVSKQEFELFCTDNASIFSGSFTGTNIQFQGNVGTVTGSTGKNTVTFKLSLESTSNWRISSIQIDGGDKTPGDGFMLGNSLSVSKREDQGAHVRITLKGAATSGYKADAAGLCDLVLDVTLTDPKGAPVFEKKAMLNLKRKVRGNGSVTWSIWFSLPKPISPGDFEVDLTVHDQVARASLSKTYSLSLKGK